MDVAQFTRSPTEGYLGGFQVPFLFMAKFGLLRSVGNKDSGLLTSFPTQRIMSHLCFLLK